MTMLQTVHSLTRRLRDWAFGDGHTQTNDLSFEDQKPFMDKSDSEEDADSSEDESRYNRYNHKTHPRRRLALLMICLGAVIMLGVYAFYTLLTDVRSGEVPNSPSTQVQGGTQVTAHCGTTPEEAKERGCFWDIMSFGWSHPNCFDKEESNKWAAEYGPWEWHMGPDKPDNSSQPLSLEELPYTPVVWTTQGYHIQHCLYVLKMIHVASMKNATVTNEGIELAHTDHCVKLMADSEFTEYSDVNTLVHLLFVQCVTLT